MPTRAPIAKPAWAGTAARDRERVRRAGGLRRLYDCAQWRKRTQPAVLAMHPMCRIAELCGGQAPSTDADHIIPAVEYVAMHGGDERCFFDLRNLQGACHACHTWKTSHGR
jgi:hypothetical protein